MEEESFFVSADEAEEGETAYRDARRVEDGKGDGARRAETGRGDDDAFEDASDAADDSFEDPIDTSNAPAPSSGAEFVSGTDTDGGGHRRAPRAPPRARTSAPPGIATSTVTRGSRVDTSHHVEGDAVAARRPDDADGPSPSFTTVPRGANANGEHRETANPSLVDDAQRLAALAFASAAADGSETDSRDGGFASAGDAATEPEDDRRPSGLTSHARSRRRPADASAATEPEDDSFADAGAEIDASTEASDAPNVSAPGTKHDSFGKKDRPARPPLTPPLAPPSPLAPGSTRARSGAPLDATAAGSSRADGRKDPTVPATASRRAKPPTFGLDGASDGASGGLARAASLGASWGDENDSAPRGARSSRAEALLRDARRGSSDDASESSEERSPSLRSEASAEAERAGSGGFKNERERLSRESAIPTPFAEEDASVRRASRRRAQREKYMAKLRDGFAEDAWLSPEELRRRAATTRRNAHSEPDVGRFDFGEDAGRGSAGALASDDGRYGRRASSFASRRSVSATYERGSATAGERRGSSRFAARAAAAEEAARARFSRAGAPETDRGARFEHLPGTRTFPDASPSGMVPVPVPHHPAGVGPEAMLWQLQQQQQMVFQQMQQLRLAQQQQQLHAGYGYPHPEMSSALLPASAGSHPRLDAFELVRRNAVEEVTRLVEARVVSVHQPDAAGNSLLMWACARGHRRLTKFLLRRGAAVNGRNAVGDTPLHFCVAGGHGELAAYLIAKGADATAANDAGATPRDERRARAL